MIKKLGLFIFGLVSLGLINFSNAGSYTYTGSVVLNVPKSTAVSNAFSAYFTVLFPIEKLIGGNVNVSYNISNVSTTCSDLSYQFVRSLGLCYTPGGSSSVNSNGGDITWHGNGTYDFSFSSASDCAFSQFNFYVVYARPISTACNISFDYVVVGNGDNIINQSDIGGGSSNCTQCESDLSSCQSSLSGANSDLSNCQSSLNNANSDLLICQSSLSGYDNTLNNCSINLNSCNSSLSACLQSNCPVNTGDVQWSALFINDIQHIGAGIINISIPQEIQREYYNTGDSFDLDIEGYNVDSEYIEGIIDTQSTLPNQVDLNNLVKVILPLFVPGLVIILFIYFIFRFIKKIF